VSISIHTKTATEREAASERAVQHAEAGSGPDRARRRTSCVVQERSHQHGDAVGGHGACAVCARPSHLPNKQHRNPHRPSHRVTDPNVPPKWGSTHANQSAGRDWMAGVVCSAPWRTFASGDLVVVAPEGGLEDNEQSSKEVYDTAMTRRAITPARAVAAWSDSLPPLNGHVYLGCAPAQPRPHVPCALSNEGGGDVLPRRPDDNNGFARHGCQDRTPSALCNVFLDAIFSDGQSPAKGQTWNNLTQDTIDSPPRRSSCWRHSLRWEPVPPSHPVVQILWVSRAPSDCILSRTSTQRTSPYPIIGRRSSLLR
jgi:hypothetical protein